MSNSPKKIKLEHIYIEEIRIDCKMCYVAIRASVYKQHKEWHKTLVTKDDSNG